MRITKIELSGVAAHIDTVLALPETGVVLVTGDNGSGKSTLIETVPLTMWGKTLRGANLWRDQRLTGSSSIEYNDILYTRCGPTGPRCKLSWTTADGTPTKYDTTKDAQIALARELGTMDQWRRSCVLSSSDASNFTSVPDAERKRLIESIVGADRLEAGYKEAREDLRTLERRLDAVKSNMRVSQVRAEAALKRIEDLASSSAVIEPVKAPDSAARQGLDDAARQVQGEIDSYNGNINDAKSASYTAKASLAVATKAVERLGVGDCPTCQQPIPDDMKASAQESVTSAEYELTKAELDVERMLAGLSLELEGLSLERKALQNRIRELDSNEMHYAMYKRNKQNQGDLESRSAEAGKDLALVNMELATLKAELTSVSQAFFVQKAATKTLSTKGVRAPLVGRVLSAIEASANSWLAKICHGDLRLSLKPTSLKADGKSLKDSVALSISTKTSEFRGYANASGGERRRIDIAIMFALAEVAESASGRTNSTLFCDEIFDALDAHGIDAVCAALRELALTRCVVVISHNATDKLKDVAVRHVHVKDGMLQAI